MATGLAREQVVGQYSHSGHLKEYKIGLKLIETPEALQPPQTQLNSLIALAAHLQHQKESSYSSVLVCHNIIIIGVS